MRAAVKPLHYPAPPQNGAAPERGRPDLRLGRPPHFLLADRADRAEAPLAIRCVPTAMAWVRRPAALPNKRLSRTRVMHAEFFPGHSYVFVAICLHFFSVPGAARLDWSLSGLRAYGVQSLAQHALKILVSQSLCAARYTFMLSLAVLCRCRPALAEKRPDNNPVQRTLRVLCYFVLFSHAPLTSIVRRNDHKHLTFRKSPIRPVQLCAWHRLSLYRGFRMRQILGNISCICRKRSKR